MSFHLDSYLAGFFDGEGTICVSRKTKHNSFDLKVCVGQKECRVLKLLRSRFGGKIYLLHSHGEPQIYQWDARRKSSIAKFLKAMTPLLVIKKEEAIMAMEFLKIMKKRRYGKYWKYAHSDEHRKIKCRIYEDMKQAKIMRGQIHWQPPLFSNQ